MGSIANCNCSSNADVVQKEISRPEKITTASEFHQAAEKIFDFIMYNYQRNKIKAVSKYYFLKAQNLFSFSKICKPNNFEQNTYFVLLQRVIDKITHHTKHHYLLGKFSYCFKDITYYQFTVNLVKEFYINNIKKKHINFYLKYFKGENNVNFNNEINLLFGMKTNFLFALLLKEYQGKNKKTPFPIKLRKLVKHYFFFYTMNSLGFVSEYQNYVKIPIEKLRELIIETFSAEKLEQFHKRNKTKESLYFGNGINPSVYLRKFGREHHAYNGEEDDDFENVFVRKKKIDLENILNFSSFKGCYDVTTLLPCGRGDILQGHTQSYYNGTFRYGLKDGIGNYYHIISEQFIEFYRGEWDKDYRDGFGVKIIYLPRLYVIYIGEWKRNEFISGRKFLIEEDFEKFKIKFREYEGEFYSKINCGKTVQAGERSYFLPDEQMKGNGRKLEVDFEINRNDGSYEIEKRYLYEGEFSLNKEDGKGSLKFYQKENDHSYEYKGEFKKGKMDGYGKIVYSDNFFIKSYEGFFCENQMFHLYGNVKFNSGDIYEGFFDENFLKSGIGLYFHYNKESKKIVESYFGGFMKDKKEGIGRFVDLKKKKILCGVYTSGTKDGIFSLASSEKGEFDENKTFRNKKNKIFFKFENDLMVGEVYE